MRTVHLSAILLGVSLSAAAGADAKPGKPVGEMECREGKRRARRPRATFASSEDWAAQLKPARLPLAVVHVVLALEIADLAELPLAGV